MPDNGPAHAVLVHGLGGTPLHALEARLAQGGVEVECFRYAPRCEPLGPCVARLAERLAACSHKRLLLVGHSFGTVLLRLSIAHSAVRPRACFLVAPPARSPQLVRWAARMPGFARFAGELWTALSDADWMDGLPLPACETTCYVGTAGRGVANLVFRRRRHDGWLAEDECALPGARTRLLAAGHRDMLGDPLIAHDVLRAAG
ncbi:MAG: hypothetical protein V4864_16860 [Pseudomonadota bacterium]